MNLFSPTEYTANYSVAGAAKVKMPYPKMIALSILAGILIAFGCAATNTAAYSLENTSIIRTVCGLLFPFGLGIVVLTGAELFTGNSLITVSVLDGKAKVSGMLRNWICVYIGNFVGSIIVAAGCAYFGQLSYSQGDLAIFTAKIALAKCTLPFGKAVVMGFFCNVLVTLGVLLAMSAKDSFSKIAGAFLPVSYFVICGFEHCIANMYYVPAGIFAKNTKIYSGAFAMSGLDFTALNWGVFFGTNLLPVTLGNVIGGVFVSVIFYTAYLKGKKEGCTKTA